MYEEAGKYLEDKVASASAADLIDMLYDRALRDLANGVELMRNPQHARDEAEAVRFVVHAQRIIAELHSSLNLKQGGELAATLSRVYEYMQYRLTESVAKKQPAGVIEVAELLGQLHEAWQSILGETPIGTDGRTSEERNKTAFLVA